MADTEPGLLPSRPLANPAPESKVVEQVVNPFDVSGGVDESGKLLAIDYDKIIGQFGAQPLTKDILERFERVTGKKPHRFMRRGIVFSHRDFDQILDYYEKGEPFYLYTGRGPSSDSMHVGHAVPFEFTKWIQDIFDVPLVIQLTDDEKYLHTSKPIDLEEFERYTLDNAKDIIAIGFNPKSTFIFKDTDFVGGEFYKNVLRMGKRITLNSMKATFGFNDSNNIGEAFFMAIQSAPAFSSSFPGILPAASPSQSTSTKQEKKPKKGSKKSPPITQIPCLIPCAIDQDPYFRQCREHARHLGAPKPKLIHSVFLPALQGPGSKMSASIDESAIFLTDTPAQIKKKINKYAFSGGQPTADLQREKGGDTKVDVPFQYLTFFLEDDSKLEEIKQNYESGKMLTGEIKAECIQIIQDYVREFQERRAKVTDEIRDEYFKRRSLEFKGNTNPKKVETETKEAKN